MAETTWQVKFKIFRKRTGKKPYYDLFPLEVDPDETILDAIERIWAFQDRTLTFRHACHHSTCGVCGMRVNGREKLTCITPIRSVTRDGSTILIEPLRNFPVLSDLVVNMGEFFTKMEKAHFQSVSLVRDADLPYEKTNFPTPLPENTERLVDCIECGLCISACPAANTDAAYVGPAVLAALHLIYTRQPEQSLLDQADHHTGLWRCHSAYECTEVCPAGVDPAWRIMDMRKIVLSNRLKSLFKRRTEEQSHV